MGAEGISALVRAQRLADTNGVTLRISDLSRRVALVLDLLEMSEVLRYPFRPLPGLRRRN